MTPRTVALCSLAAALCVGAGLGGLYVARHWLWPDAPWLHATT